MRGKAERVTTSMASLLAASSVLVAACGGEPSAEAQADSALGVYASNLPEGLNPSMVAQLTERVETENFVFYYGSNDAVAVDNQEAYHRWAVDYLGISLPKKIDYYKFSFGAMWDAAGRRASGRGFPHDYALATMYSWHPHETMHLYTYAVCGHTTIRLYDEGMSVAHEIDPLNNIWVSHWRPLEDRYIYANKVREHRVNGTLYPITSVLESRSFDAVRQEELKTINMRVLYDEAGMFVSYLIDTFGIDKMKQAICSVSEFDSREVIEGHFADVFGISVVDAERAWLTYLDSSM